MNLSSETDNYQSVTFEQAAWPANHKINDTWEPCREILNPAGIHSEGSLFTAKLIMFIHYSIFGDARESDYTKLATRN